MSDVQTIAKLVANLGFTVEDKQLNAFIGKLNATIASLKMLKQEVNKRIGISIGLNKTDMIEAKKVISGLGSTKVRLKDVEVSSAALSKVSSQLASKVGSTTVRLKDIQISDAAIRKAKADLKAASTTGGLVVPARIDTRQVGKQLREWMNTTGKKFKFSLNVDIHKRKLYENLKTAINEATSKVGTIKLKDPKIRMGIDKPYLRQEIAAAIAQIRREVKIKIDLTGHGSVSGGGAAGGGRVGTRHGALAGGVAGMAASWGRGFIPGLGGAFAVSQLNRQVQEFESQQQAAAAVSGSQTAGAATIERLRAMGNEIGFNYRSQAMPFLRMISSGTNAGMQQGEVETIFGNMAKYGRVMGLDDEAMKGSMRAVEQMLNKQQVYSEELKTQLAERMPGVISAMAEAVTGDATNTAELFKKMEAGEVKSTEVMLKFSQILERRAMTGGALEKAMKSTAAEQARFNNSWNDFVKKFGEAGFSKSMANFFKVAADLMESFGKNADWLSDVFRVLITPVTAFMRILERLNNQLPEIAKNLGLSSGELQLFAGIVLALIFPFTRLLTIISLTVVAIDDLLAAMEGKESIIGNFFDSLDESKQAKLKGLGEQFRIAGEEISKAFGAMSEAFGGFGEAIDKLTDFAFDKIIDKLNRMAAYATSVARIISSLSQGDYAGAADAAAGLGSLMVENTPLHWVMKPELREQVSGRVAELTGEGNDVALDRTAKNWMQLSPDAAKANAGFTLNGGITIEVNGIESPNEVAIVVERHLNKIFSNTAFQVPEKM